MPNARTVILYYEAVRVGEEDGNAFPEGAVIESTTWIKRGPRWVAILNQETHIHAPRTSRTSWGGRSGFPKTDFWLSNILNLSAVLTA